MSATELLLESTVKTSIVVLIALAAVSLLRRQSAAVRHWILASAILCAALIPVLGALVPSWHLPINTAPATGWIDRQARSQDARTGTRENVRAERARDLSRQLEDSPSAARVWPSMTRARSRAISAIWIGGVGISLLILSTGLGRLAWIASHARPVLAERWTESAAHIAHEYGLHRPVRLLQTDHPALMVTWGAVQPKIMLPRAAPHWVEDRIRVVLAHELAHIRRGDWMILMFTELVRAVYWFNPLVWLACTRLRQESELATDDAVLNQGMTGTDYAGHLLNLAQALTGRRTWLPAPSIARPSSLERRVHAMLNNRRNRAPATRSARLATLAVVSCVTVALAAAQGTFATFSGTVFDETNGVLPDVTLILTNAQSHAKHEVKSDGTGHFEFVGLPPGDYQLETKIAGFATLRGTLTLSGQDAQRDLVLQIGSLEETITIRGGTSIGPVRSGGSGRLARRPDPICGKEPPVANGEKIGGNIRAPRKLVDVKPYYPPQLYEANIGGTVVLQARIDTEGRVSAVEVVSPAHPDLNAAAIEAVRQWEFDSTILNCRKVEVAMKVTANFIAR
jgi:TonB family protein